MMADIREEAFIIVFDSYMKLTLYSPTQCDGCEPNTAPTIRHHTQPLQDPTVNLSVWTNH